MNAKCFFYSIFILLFLTACGVTHVHDKGEIAHEKVAFIEGLPGYNPLSIITVQIYSIDNKKVTRKTNVFEVSAGEHRIEVVCRREQPDYIQHHFVFNMTLKAGHRYKPQLDMTQPCHIDYIDKTTGKKYIGEES